MTVNPWPLGVLDKTITRIRAGTTTNEYGSTVFDWPNADQLDMQGRANPPILKVRLGSHAADEDMSGRDAVRHDAECTVFNDDWLATDRAEIDGITYEVMGNPYSRTDLDGNYLYTRVLLREVSG